VTPVRPEVSKRERAVSGLAGASGGLGLLSLAKSLPPGTAPIPELLIYASPFATIIISAVWSVGVIKLRRWLRRRSLNASLRSAIRLRDQITASGDSSAKIKKQAQVSVEKIQALVLELILEDTRDPSNLADFIPVTIPVGGIRGGTSVEESAPVHNS